MIGGLLVRLSLAAEANGGLSGALFWLRGQMNPVRRGAGGAWILPDAEYAPEDTGTLQGSFNVPEGTEPARPAAVTVTAPVPLPDRFSGTIRGGVSVPASPGGLVSPVLVDAPAPIPDRYTGTISGRLQEAPAGGTYRVDAYLLSGGGYAKQGEAPVSPLGAWTFAATGGEGEWRFRAVNAVTGVQVGAEWQASLNGARTTQYRVDGYLDTVLQGSAPVLLRGSEGAWEMAATGQPGEWRFRLVNTGTGAQEGREWRPGDAARYETLELRLYEFTDAPHLLATSYARGDGRWSFTSSSANPKLVTLHRLSDGAELARWATRTGWVRAHAYAADDPLAGTAAEHRATVYAQSVAILAFLAAGESGAACSLARGLVLRQHADGSWPVALHQLQTTGWDAYIRPLPVAWAAYALLKAADAGTGVPGCDPAALRTAAGKALAWLEARRSPTHGLVGGGSGTYVTNTSTGAVTFNASFPVTGFSTDANLAAWMAWKASRDAHHQQVADEVRGSIVATLWDPATRRFRRGVDAFGTADATGTLELHTWGSLALRAWRMADLASDALSNAERHFELRDGRGAVLYRAFSPQEGSPAAPLDPWLEGSFGAQLALYRAGQDTRDLEAGLAPYQEVDGGFRMDADREAGLAVDTHKATASTGWYVLAALPNALLWTDFDPNPLVAERILVYRMTVFAPKSDTNPEEAQVLRPRALSGHADAFQVTTEQHPPAGWKPYLTLRSTRRGTLDPRHFHAEGGEVIVEVLDPRLDSADNQVRWATAFLGDERGRTWLQGLRAEIEVSVDGGARWDPYFAGRVALPAAPSASEHGPVLRLHVQDHRVEEYREVFVGCPHPDHWALCHPSPLLPAGYGVAPHPPGVPQLFRTDTEPWEHDVPGIFGTVHSTPTSGARRLDIASGSVMTSSTLMRPNRNRPPLVLFEAAYRRDKNSDRALASGGEICPDVMVQLRKVKRVNGQWQYQTNAFYQLAPVKVEAGFLGHTHRGFDDERESPLFLDDAPGEDYKNVRHVGIRPFPSGHPLYSALPATGDDTYEVVLWNYGPPRPKAPLIIKDTDGVTLYQALLDGIFSDQHPLTMRPQYPAIPYHPASFAAARARLADNTAGQTGGARVRFLVEGSQDLQKFFEHELAPILRHASVVHPDGAIRLMDLRLPQSPGTLPVVEEDDFVAADWEQGTDAVTSVIAGLDLFGWANLELAGFFRGDETPLDVHGMGIQRKSMGSAYLSEFASHLPLAEHQVKLGGLRPVDDNAEGVMRALEPIARWYLALFGTGAAYLDQRVRRATVDAPDRFPGGLLQGSWAVVHAPEAPNPAINRRGGRRVMLLVQREEDGAELRLRWLDAGPDANPVGIGLGNLRKSTARPRSEVLVDVANVAAGGGTGADAELDYALVGAGAARPAEDSPRWVAAGRFADGTAVLSRLAGGPRVYVRGRRAGRAPLRLPSDWSYTGYVDLDTLAAPTLLAAAIVGPGEVRVTWTPGLADASTEVYVAEGAAPAEWDRGQRVSVAAPGVSEHLLRGLRPETTYWVAVRHVDADGATSAFLTTFITTGPLVAAAPRPAGLAVIVGAIA